MPRSLTSEYREALVHMLLTRDGYTCLVCGETLLYGGMFIRDAVEIDHKTPVYAGGSHLFDNLQITHRSCNHRGRPRSTQVSKPVVATVAGAHNCEKCGTAFMQLKTTSKYCSDRCGNAVRVALHRARKRT